MITEKYTDSHLLKIIVSQLFRTDCEHRKVFEELGISHYLHEPVNIRDRQEISWLENFIKQLDAIVQDPLFFVKAGSNAQFSDMGSPGLLAMVCENYGETVHYSSKYQHYLRSNFHHHFFIDDDTLISRLDSSKLGDSFAIDRLIEVELCTVLAISRAVTGSIYAIDPSKIEFAHSPRTSNIKYMEAINAEVSFNCEHNQLVSVPMALEVPSYNADPELFKILKKRVEKELKEMKLKYSFSDAIKQHIKNDANLENYTLSSAAERLNISKSTLKRKLREEETSFQELLDNQRLERAKHMLLNSAEPMADIAVKLGFSSYGAFSRAFKNWSSMTPAKYREIEHL